jgi:hypothetical protein
MRTPSRAAVGRSTSTLACSPPLSRSLDTSDDARHGPHRLHDARRPGVEGLKILRPERELILRAPASTAGPDVLGAEHVGPDAGDLRERAPQPRDDDGRGLALRVLAQADEQPPW